MGAYQCAVNRIAAVVLLFRHKVHPVLFSVAGLRLSYIGSVCRLRAGTRIVNRQASRRAIGWRL
jgi:hypothetical protein